MSRILCVLVLTLLSCASDEKQPRYFQELDFSYNDTWTSSFSIKFTPSDTVYVRQHFWYGNHNASQSDLKEGATYIGVLNKEQTHRLDSFFTHLDLKKYATWYIEDVQDGTSYDFYLKTDSFEQSIGLYGVSVPTPLLAFGRWICETKEQLILSAVDSSIKFRSYRPLPPPPALDLRKFVPPTSRNEASTEKSPLFTRIKKAKSLLILFHSRAAFYARAIFPPPQLSCALVPVW